MSLVALLILFVKCLNLYQLCHSVGSFLKKVGSRIHKCLQACCNTVDNKRMASTPRYKCKILFLLCVILEYSGFTLVLVTMFQPKMSPCVLAGELTVNFAVYMCVAPAFLIPDLVLLVSMLLLSAVGLEPFATAYNFVAFVMCLVGGAALLIHKMCGNKAQYLLIGTGILTLLAAVGHILNALLGNKNLPDEEKQWPAKRPHRVKVKAKKKK